MNAIHTPLLARLAIQLKRLHRAYLQVFGIPDYERYLEHMASHHPDEAPQSRRAYAAHAIDRKYHRAGARCC